MGFEDRQYTREDSMFGGDRTGLAQFSIVAILIAINFIVWIADTFSPVVVKIPEAGVYVHWVSSWLRLDTGRPWMIWTFLTYGFTHASIESSIWHIIFNMFVLFMFGRPVAERLGRYEFLRFYLSAIVFAGLAFFFWYLIIGERGSCVGASGATMAVLILFILWYPHQKLYLMGVVEVPAWLMGAGVIGYDLLRAFSPNSEVAWQAHLGGALFAWLYLHFEWNFRWMGSLTEWIPKRKGNLNIYNPDTRSTKSDQLRVEGDRILAKISEEGEESLSRKERKTLEKYSKMLRSEK
ncbi:rhomboid family protein [Mariniblastus fucicola]|uniref:Rhomboid family protein n=1 Tax=Mariniblastus fucicola TaxID=980251 RepID=A0A5B9PK60_9BACT|nr:rhomboid family intramembrane serine protease [Mariniblastus fucicola]QEG25066.1 Rhomboid family protein [Mariniblastus fucicola]